MSNPVSEKLRLAKKGWHKTIGEYVIIYSGILIAAVALAIGFNYGKAPVETVPDSGSGYEIKYNMNGERKPVQIIYLNNNESYIARVKALSEAISSYHGVKVTEIQGNYSVPDILKDDHVVLIPGDTVIDDLEVLRALVKGLGQRKIPLFWLGPGLGSVAQILDIPHSEKGGVSVTPPTTILEYKNTKISGAGLQFSRYGADEFAKSGEVLAKINLHGTFERAAIIRHGNLIYSAFYPFSQDFAQLAFAVVMDALSLFVGKHDVAPKLIFRLEDINGRDYNDQNTSFTKTINILTDSGVYVHLGIIPVMVDGYGEEVATIAEATPVIEAVRANPEQIGIVQHGYKHYRIDPRNEGYESGYAFEYFLDDDQTMGEDAAREFAQETILQGYKVMVRSGLKPLMFEAPHYIMSSSQQQVAEKLFSLLQHDPLFYNPSLHKFSLPWMTQRNTAVYVPASAGYVDAVNAQSVDEILQLLERAASILPDPMFVVFYHPFIAEIPGREQDLSRLIQGIKGLGYDFVNMMDQVVPAEDE